ncbi:hypothetical protein NCS52_00155200 [Fusarium sp. LHS14.1]|nr:hypothetical protein NCS52_00155200 [Fusarium sp. LHS14.1]
MPTTYTVVFANEHGSGSDYVFCNEEPIINNDATAGNVISNAWMGRYVANGSDFTLTAQFQFHACKVCEAVELGTNKNDGGKISSISCNDCYDDRLIEVAEYLDALAMVPQDGSVTFDKTRTKTAPTGCFTVVQPTGFNASDNFAFGLAQTDSIGGQAPKSINMTTNIQPIIKFFVLKVQQRSSDGVNYQSFSRKPGVVDFTTGDGKGLYTARVVHEKNGDFTVTYK